MTNRERVKAILNYEDYDRLPVVHFGYWRETLDKWACEGHITTEQAEKWFDGGPVDLELNVKLGFDFDWSSAFHAATFLSPPFKREVIENLPDGSRHVRNAEGVTVLEKPGVVSIPAEIDHLLKGRKEWEDHYLPKLQWSEDRFRKAYVFVNGRFVRWEEGGLEFLRDEDRDYVYGISCGSMIGVVRNILGVLGLTYLQADDEKLFDEIIETVADLNFRVVEAVLAEGPRFDFGHFWEDICFRGGPLVHPVVFAEKVGPHYKRITDLLREHGVNIVSLDCDGCIDTLVPIWLENGVNTMFPVEVGTWGASIAPWRKQYGRELRGVGGMDKRVFAQDFAAVDAEVERLNPSWN